MSNLIEPNMTGVIVAMQEEANPIIEALNLEDMGEMVYIGSLPNGEPIILAVCGIGKVNAQNKAWTLMSLGCEKIVNYGTCGFCGEGAVGGVYFPNLIFDGDFDMSMFGNPSKDPANVNFKYVMDGKRLWPKDPCELYSYSTFITDRRVEGHLVDMEGYSIASACSVVGVPYILCKVVSDCADSEATDTFTDNVEENNFSSVIDKNKEEIIKCITNFDSKYSEIYKLVEEKEE